MTAIIHGPYDQADWYTMGQLRQDIREMRADPNPSRFDHAIRWDQKVLRENFYSRTA